MDLADLDTVAACNKGAEIELFHPVSKAPLGIFITVLGKDSDRYREYIRERVNDDIRKAQMAKKRGKDEETPTIEKAEERGVELLAACTLAWNSGDRATLTMRGEELPCTVVNAKRVYSEMPWVKAQVDDAVADMENFLPG